MRTAILLAAALLASACYEEEPTQQEQDCEDLCDKEEACIGEDENYHGWDYCMQDCEQNAPLADPELVKCIFHCFNAFELEEVDLEVCQTMFSCVGVCHGE